MSSLTGSLSLACTISGEISPTVSISGSISQTVEISGAISLASILSGAISLAQMISGIISVPQIIMPNPYDGDYEVTPSTTSNVTLDTAYKTMAQDINVLQIPYYETSNESGYTVYIGSEV